MRTDPYVGRDREISSYSLREANQPNPHFVDQARYEPSQSVLPFL